MIHEPSQLEYLKVSNNSDTLVILLHGYGAGQHDLFGLNEYLGHYDYIFPNGPIEISMGAYTGFAWFPIDMEELNRSMITGEKRRFEDKNPLMLKTSVEKIISMVEAFRSQYQNIFIGGFSQGSMVATHVALTKMDYFKGLVLFSSALIHKTGIESLLATRSQRIPFIQSHGTGDGVLNYFDAKSMYDFLKESGFLGEFISFHGAHEIPLEIIKKTNQFLVNNIH